MTLTLYCVKVFRPGAHSQFVYNYPIDKIQELWYYTITKRKGIQKNAESESY